MTEHNAHAYCDEAGNTGGNLMDASQPLFMVGGWLVLDHLIEVAEAIVRLYAEAITHQARELHAADVLRSDRRTRGLWMLMRDLCEMHCGPVFQIVEKRFLIVGHVFETFLKPDFNANVPPWFEDYFVVKRELMEKVYGLPDDVLTRFERAYVDLDRSLLVESLNEITAAVRPETKLWNLLLGAYTNMDAVVDHLNTGRVHYDSWTVNTPNAASFFVFFQFVERSGRAAGVPRIVLVHDRNRFESTFRQLFDEFKNDPSHVVFEEGPVNLVHRGFESLSELRFANSKEEPLLQAADALVSSMYRYATNVYQGRQSPEAMTEIARLFVPDPPVYPAMIKVSSADWFAEKLYRSVEPR